MCCEKPYLWLVPISTVYSGLLVIIYVAFYLTFGPLSLAQEVGYFLFIIAKCLMVISLCGAIYVILRDLPDLAIGGIVVILFVLACMLGLMSSVKLLEPTKEEMLEYLEEHQNNRPYLIQAPIFLLYVQSNSECCGINSYEDYNLVERDEKVVSVPESCCIVPRPNCGNNVLLGSPNSTIDRIHVKGCVPTSLLDIGREEYAIYKVANTVPITSVMMDVVVLIIFIYHFRCIRREFYTPNPATLVSYPTGAIISWIDSSALPEGPIKKPQPIPLITRNPYRELSGQ